MNDSDIKEWHVELRDNELSMDEQNVKAKEKKLEHKERVLDEERAAEKQEQEEREKKMAEQEKEVTITVNYHMRLPDYIHCEVAEARDSLRRQEVEFREKNAILEILLKVWCFMITRRNILGSDSMMTKCMTDD